MNDEMFKELLASIEEAGEIIKGEKKASRVTAFHEPEVKAIRNKTGLSQSRFATLVGVSKRTLENWEQGRRTPTGPAKTLLRLVDADPAHALKMLHG